MNLDKVKRIIKEINKIHYLFSIEFFKTNKSYNLSKNINHIPIDFILKYRLNLHESINDYLFYADIHDINYYYRVKTTESILDKIERYSNNKFPLNNWMNDIFGIRIIVNKDLYKGIKFCLDDFKEEFC